MTTPASRYGVGIKCSNVGRVAGTRQAFAKPWFPASTLSGLTASKVFVLGSLGQRQLSCTTLKQTCSHKYRPRMIAGPSTCVRHAPSAPFAFPTGAPCRYEVLGGFGQYPVEKHMKRKWVHLTDSQGRMRLGHTSFLDLRFFFPKGK